MGVQGVKDPLQSQRSVLVKCKHCHRISPASLTLRSRRSVLITRQYKYLFLP